MANVFDQFDASSAGPPASPATLAPPRAQAEVRPNVFDRFDADGSGPSASAPNVFDAFDEAPPAGASLGATIATGAVEGLKAIPRGAGSMIGTGVSGAAGLDPVEAEHRDVAKYREPMTRWPGMTPQEKEAFVVSLRDENPVTRWLILNRLDDLESGRATVEDIEAVPPPTPMAERPLFKAGETITEATRAAIPAGKGWEESVPVILGEGLGSLGAGALATIFGGGLAGGALFTAAGSGEAAQRAVEYDRAEKAAGRPGLTEEQILTATVLGTGPGATDMLPLETAFGRLRIPAPLRRPLARTVARIGGQAFIEGLQEGGQQALQNFIAQGYDPEQDILADVAENAGAGAGVGGVFQTIVEAVTPGRSRGAKRRGTPEPAGDPESAEPPRDAIPEPAGPEPEAIPGDQQPNPFDRFDGFEPAVPAETPVLPAAGEAPAPPVGAPVTVAVPDGEPIRGRIVEYIDGEAMVAESSTGELHQVPVEMLAVEPEVAAPGQPEAPPVAGEPGSAIRPPIPDAEPAAGAATQPVTETPGPEVAADPLVLDTGNGKRARFADETAAAVFALGRKRDLARNGAQPAGRSDQLLRAERQDIADRLGVALDEVNAIADDYRHRVQRQSRRDDVPDSFRAAKLQAAAAQKKTVAQPDLDFADRGEAVDQVATAIAPQETPVAEAPVPGTRAAPVTIETPEHVAEASAVVDTGPTEAMKAAGNYAKGHVRLHGLDISIENPKGAERRGTDKGGKPWAVTMPAAYGYIKRTEAADGDQVDVYIGDAPDSKKVYVVDQVDPDTKAYDEPKVIMGTGSRDEALDLYRKGFSDGRGAERIGAVREYFVGPFRKRLAKGLGVARETTAAQAASAPKAESGRKTETKEEQRPDQYALARQGIVYARSKTARDRVLELTGANSRAGRPYGTALPGRKPKARIITREDVFKGKEPDRLARTDETPAIARPTEERRLLENNLRSIVSRIAGRRVDVGFADRIGIEEAIPAEQIAELRQAASTSDGVLNETVGGYWQRGAVPAEAVIRIALSDPAYDPLTTAFHEAWHQVELGLMSEQEQRVLASQMPKLRMLAAEELGDAAYAAGIPDYEVTAIAFQRYARQRARRADGSGIHIAIRRFFDRVLAMIAQVRAMLRRRGITSYEKVFARAYEGGFASRAGEGAGAEARPAVERAALSLPRNKDELADQVRGLPEDLRGPAQALLPLNYLPDWARPNQTAIGDYLDVKRRMDAVRGDRQHAADDMVQNWRKRASRDPRQAKLLSDLMHESTVAGIDPTRPHDADTKAKPDYAAIMHQWAALSPDLKRLYVEVRDHYEQQRTDLDNALLTHIRKRMEYARDEAERDYQAQLDRIQEQGLTGKEKDEAETKAWLKRNTKVAQGKFRDKARLTQMRRHFESNRVQGPYFPLGRFGNYFAVEKDGDGRVMGRWHFEKEADRRRFLRDHKRNNPDARLTTGVLSERSSARGGLDQQLVGEIEGILENAGVSEEVMDEVWQRYLTMLPEASIRKRQIHRAGTAGYHEDALRTFAFNTFHAAHQIARLEYSPDLEELVQKADRQAKAADDPVVGGKIANELAKRHQYVMNPESNTFATGLTQLGFLWFLGATPAAAAVNLSQTVMVGIPVLGARYGMGKSVAALNRAMADFARGKGHIEQGRLTKDERDAIKALYDAGVLDRTRALDLAGVAEEGMEYAPLRARVMAVIAAMFHHAERLNREVTSLAAYRLARKKGADHEAAVKIAGDLTWKTHFDYSAANRPRVMQKSWTRPILLFRNFQINMLYRLFRDVHQSFKGETKEARHEARVQLAGVSGMMALMAGATGTPLVAWVIIPLYGMIFGDDDDPRSAEDIFREDVTEALGPTAAGLVLEGVPGYALDISLTQRIGMPDLWFQNDGRERTAIEWWERMGNDLLGPLWAAGGSGLRGWQAIQDGDGVLRGIEIAAPKAVNDILQAWRYANEGVTNLRGDPVVARDDLSPWNLIAQAAGFTPAKVAEQYRRNTSKKAMEERIYNRRRQVLDHYWQARESGDRNAMREALAAVRVFNAVPFHRTVRISADTLRQSVATHRRLQRRTEAGILIQNQRLNRDLNRMVPDPLH